MSGTLVQEGLLVFWVLMILSSLSRLITNTETLASNEAFAFGLEHRLMKADTFCWTDAGESLS
jgi:hypothetical protein